MKMMKTLRTAMAALLALVLCMQGPASAAGTSGTYDEVKGRDCTLTVEYAPDGEPMTGVTFRIWKVGTMTEGGWLPFQEIGSYNVLNGEGTWLAKASTLLSYLQRDNAAPTASAATGEDGKVKFDIPAAEQGLYLVAGESQVREGIRYTPTTFLIMVPYSQDLSTWETAIETHSKFTAVPEQTLIQRHVLKSWRDGGHREERPTEIVVDLLRDGQVYDTVTLTAAGNWRFDWTGLDAQYEWTVAERESGRYSVLVEQEGITFHITNTWIDVPENPESPPPTDPPTDPETPEESEDPEIDVPENPESPTPIDPPSDTVSPEKPRDPEIDIDDPGPPLGNLTDDPPGPDDPESPTDTPDSPTDPGNPGDPDINIDDPDVPLTDGPGLPQTGQLWWPVLPMAMGGLVLGALGWKRRRDWSSSDEG